MATPLGPLLGLDGPEDLFGIEQRLQCGQVESGEGPMPSAVGRDDTADEPVRRCGQRRFGGLEVVVAGIGDGVEPIVVAGAEPLTRIGRLLDDHSTTP